MATATTLEGNHAAASSRIAAERRNQIGAIRLVLAVLVVHTHCYQLCLGVDAPDPVMRLCAGQESGGSLAVSLFFLLSGHLITKSWLQSRSAASYLRKRILRIYPAYWVALVFSATLAASCTEPSPLSYLRGLVRSNDSIVRAVLLLQFGGLDQYGAFAGNPYQDAVNHPLWTLQPEFACYLLIAGAGLLGGLQQRWFVLLVCVAAHVGYSFNVLRLGVGEATFWRCLTYFAYGSAFYLYRDKVPLQAWPLLVISAAGLVIGALAKPWLSVVLPLAGGYLLFSLAFASRAPLSWWFARTDLSYGVYIYAFPIQQACVYALGIREPMSLFGVCVPIIGAVAYGSWVWVERPCLGRA
jgi:peptidoglycan/LPS O-acetylase OafA/YrhL